MTFTYDEADIGKIITRYQKIENNYYVEYLDETSASYFCSNSEEEKRLKDLMLKQAIDRDKHIDMSMCEFLEKFYIGCTLLSSFCASILYANNQNALYCIALALVVFGAYKCRKLDIKIKELKKYKMFLSIIDNLDEINKSSFLKYIEFENIYQTPLNINTLDTYSYGNVKTIYKNINNLNKHHN